MTLAAVGDPWLLVELGVGVLVLGLIARGADRLEMSPIPLYLIAGIVLGQLSDGPLAFSEDVVEAGAQIGIVLLLFMLGLEYTGEELAGSLRTGLPAGLCDLANFLPGVLCGVVLGWGVEAVLLLGGITYISSSGVIAKLIADLGRIGNRETPAILTLLVIEDLAMALFLPLVTVLLTDVAALDAAGLVALALLAAGLALLIAITRKDAISRLIATRSDEVLLLTTLGFVLLVAGVAEGLQISAAVGAFLAGIVVSGSVADRARELLAPFRDLFAAVFFIFFGMGVELGGVGAVLPAVIAVAIVSSASKVATGWYAAARIGARSPGRLRAGTSMIARGEFSIVIAGLGVTAGVEPRLGALAAGYVLVTALAGPLLARWPGPLARLARLPERA